MVKRSRYYIRQFFSVLLTGHEINEWSYEVNVTQTLEPEKDTPLARASFAPTVSIKPIEIQETEEWVWELYVTTESLQDQSEHDDAILLGSSQSPSLPDWLQTNTIEESIEQPAHLETTEKIDTWDIEEQEVYIEDNHRYENNDGDHDTLPRKKWGFTSLKDVLRERGNFWNENQSKQTHQIHQKAILTPPVSEIDVPAFSGETEDENREDPWYDLSQEDSISEDTTPVWYVWDAEGISSDNMEWPIWILDNYALPYQENEEISHWIPSIHEIHNEDTIVSSISTPKTITIGISRDGNESIHITSEALAHHMLIVGRTGSGKSTLLERMIIQDIDAGHGVGIIDPHGDLYERIIHQIPRSRSNDVVLFDLTDTEYPVGFNILEHWDQLPSLIASSIVGVFKKIFGYSWGPRLEYILRNATLTLIEKPGSTLLDLTLLLTDEDFRYRYIKNIHNPFLQKFWNDEFGNLSQSRQAEVTSPILNKVGQFLSVPLIRNIISQPVSGFSPRWIMDREKIFLSNLSKGKIWEDVSEMIGSLLVSKFQLDVMSRANIPPHERRPFRLYVDEFQNFATESFTDILSEARKYGLELVIAHQYLGQVDKKLLESILGNIGSMVIFHTSFEDAKILAPNIGQELKYEDLSEQNNFEFVSKTMKNHKKIVQKGELLTPDMVPLRPHLQDPNKLQALVREKYAKKRDFVEEKIVGKVRNEG